MIDCFHVERLCILHCRAAFVRVSRTGSLYGKLLDGRRKGGIRAGLERRCAVARMDVALRKQRCEHLVPFEVLRSPV